MTDPIQTSPIQAGQPSQTEGQPAQKPRETSGASFSETLSQRVRFSNHAQKRLERRNINLTDDGISRLAEAVEKAEKRGGQESLVLVDDLAFIVNVQERLVVTAMDRNKSGDGVFTQIDSVVIADKKQDGTAGDAAEQTNVPDQND